MSAIAVNVKYMHHELKRKKNLGIFRYGYPYLYSHFTKCSKRVLKQNMKLVNKYNIKNCILNMERLLELGIKELIICEDIENSLKSFTGLISIDKKTGNVVDEVKLFIDEEAEYKNVDSGESNPNELRVAIKCDDLPSFLVMRTFDEKGKATVHAYVDSLNFNGEKLPSKELIYTPCVSSKWPREKNK